MSTEPVVAFGQVVTFFYAVRDDAGRVLDGTRYQEPASYLHGAGNILEPLERSLVGKRAGDRVQVTLASGEAYGERDEDLVKRVPREALPPDVVAEAGRDYAVQRPDGSVARVRIVAVEGTEVVLDLNHPFAGKTLHFELTVAAVRPATEVELAHGHPHEPRASSEEAR